MKIDVWNFCDGDGEVAVYNCTPEELSRIDEINSARKPTWWKVERMHEEYGVDEGYARFSYSLTRKVFRKHALYALKRKRLMEMAKELAKGFTYSSPSLIVEYYDFRGKLPESDDDLEDFLDQMASEEDYRSGR